MHTEIQNEVWRVAGGDMSICKTCWFDCLRWGMLLGVTAWSAFGAAQESANRKHAERLAKRRAARAKNGGPERRSEKRRACGQHRRGIPTPERKSGRSVSDESGKRVEVPGAAVGHCFDEFGEQSGCGG